LLGVKKKPPTVKPPPVTNKFNEDGKGFGVRSKEWRTIIGRRVVKRPEATKACECNR